MPCLSHPTEGIIYQENYVIVSATSLSNTSHTRRPTLVNEFMEFILFAQPYAKSATRAEIKKCVAPQEIQRLHGQVQNHHHKLRKK